MSIKDSFNKWLDTFPNRYGTMNAKAFEAGYIAAIEECTAICKHFEEKADALNDSISDDDDPNEGRSEWIMGKAAAASRIGKAIQNLKEEK